MIQKPIEMKIRPPFEINKWVVDAHGDVPPFHLLYNGRGKNKWILAEYVSVYDGPEAMRQAIDSNCYIQFREHMLLDRRILTDEDRDAYFLRLRHSLNIKELEELPAHHHELYEWSNSRNEYLLKAEYLDAWGIKP